MTIINRNPRGSGTIRTPKTNHNIYFVLLKHRVLPNLKTSLKVSHDIRIVGRCEKDVEIPESFENVRQVLSPAGVHQTSVKEPTEQRLSNKLPWHAVVGQKLFIFRKCVSVLQNLLWNSFVAIRAKTAVLQTNSTKTWKTSGRVRRIFLNAFLN